MTTITGKYACPKCGHREHEIGSMRVSGSGFMAILDLEDRQFTTASCTRCGFTELYRVKEESLLALIADGVVT